MRAPILLLVFSAHRDSHEEVRFVDLFVYEYVFQAAWDVDSSGLVYDVALFLVAEYDLYFGS